MLEVCSETRGSGNRNAPLPAGSSKIAGWRGDTSMVATATSYETTLGNVPVALAGRHPLPVSAARRGARRTDEAPRGHTACRTPADAPAVPPSSQIASPYRKSVSFRVRSPSAT